jgi:hypothetical protein
MIYAQSDMCTDLMRIRAQAHESNVGRRKIVLTSLISITGISSSSSYSDSSSELLSSSDELVSVGVEGNLIDVKVLSSRKVAILSANGLTPWLVTFNLLGDGFASFGGRTFLVEGRAGVNEPKRKVNNDGSDKAKYYSLTR